MDVEILIPLSFFAFLGAVILVPILAKERTKRSAHELVSKAIDRGQTLDPALVDQLTQTMVSEGDRARKSLGSGVILLALTGGIVTSSALAGGFGPHADNDFIYPSVILGFVGAAFIVLAVFDYATKKRAA